MKHKKGNSLVEVLVGVAIVTIVILAIIELTTKSTANAGLSKRQAQATALAKEKIELVRGEKENTDWNIYCGTWSGVTQTETIDEFRRVTTIVCGTENGRSTMQVHTDVTWAERGANKTAKQEVTFIRY